MELPVSLQLLLQRDTSALAAFYASVVDVDGGGGLSPRWCAVGGCGGAAAGCTARVDLDARTVAVRDGGGRESWV